MKKTNKGFTLIELLVVISIIGVLATMIVGSISDARTKAEIASIKVSLKNIQTAAVIYSLDNDTFAGLCNYANTNFHESIQPHIDKLKSIAGNNRVRCIVRTSNVPDTGSSNFVAAEQLERKNFGVAVYYDQTHYGVSMEGVITIDKIDTGTGTNWTAANQRCINAGKRLVPVEILKAINDYGAHGGNLGFSSSYFWSATPTPSNTSLSYAQAFYGNGGIFRNSISTNSRVRCAL